MNAIWLTTLSNRTRRMNPPERLALLRIVIGGYALLFLIVRSTHLWNSAGYPRSRWESVGVLSFLSEAPNPTVFRFLLLLSIPTGLAFVCGWRYRFFGPVFAALFLLITTFRFSWGSVLHTEHLVVIHVLIIACATADHAWTVHPRREAASSNSYSYYWAIEACAIATVIGYTVSGIAKIRYGGWDWISGDVLRNQIAFDNLRKILLGDIHSPFAGWIVRNDTPLKLIAPITVLLEIGAPLALFFSSLRKMWIWGAWLFHVGVLVFMAIAFPYQLLAIAYLPLLLMKPFLEKHHPRSASLHVHAQLSQPHEQ